MIDICCAPSSIVNATELNLCKFLCDIEKLLPINLLKSKLWYCYPFNNVGVLSEGGLANCGRVAAKIAHFTLIISGITGLKFSKFLYDVVTSLHC